MPKSQNKATNGELNIMINELKDRMEENAKNQREREDSNRAISDERHSQNLELLKDIKTQAIATNGGLTRVKGQIIFVQGVLWALGTVLTFVVIPLVFMFLQGRIKSTQNAQEVVKLLEDKYDLKVND